MNNQEKKPITFTLRLVFSTAGLKKLYAIFSPFQINTQLKKKIITVILDAKKTLLITFLTISNQYTIFIL